MIFWICILLAWVVGVPIVLMIDAYIQGRYKESLFPDQKSDGENYVGAIMFWPIYFPLAIVYTICECAFIKVYDLTSNGIDYFNKKGKQVNDLDYQAEKYLLDKKDD